MTRMRVTASGQILGATINGLDLARRLSQDELDSVVRLLGEHGVLRFPRQKLTARKLADFAARFGQLEINVANAYQEPGIPEAKVEKQFSGRVLDAKLTDLAAGLHGWIYAITFLTPQDNVLVLKVDAGTGVILQVEGHGIEEARKPQ